MKTEVETISINGTEYVKKGCEKVPAVKLDGMNYCIVRTYSAGVFAGYVEAESENGKQITLRDSRRIWYWDGAASLSQLANEGVKKPEKCKFAQVVNKCKVNECIEMIYCTELARKNIEGVKIWQQ